MRTLQAKLARERKEQTTLLDTLEKEVEAKRKEKIKIQAEIDRDLKDVKEQREQLYRKLEVLRAQGIFLAARHSLLQL